MGHDLEDRAEARGRTESELSVSLPLRLFYEGLGNEILEGSSIDIGERQHLAF